jgi:hypothetical protein
MANVVWYWEYQLKIWDEIDSKEEIRSGVVAADTITEAMKEIEDYYGDEIMEVQMLKAITDGVFEFQYVMEDTDFDFVISKKV